MRIFVSKWFDRFARKNDIDNLMLINAIRRAESGLIDADLGQGVIKQRVAREGQGKSKGYRTIIVFQQNERSFFVYGFAKNNRDNLRRDEQESFKSMAGYLFSLSDEILEQLIKNGDFMEVNDD